MTPSTIPGPTTPESTTTFSSLYVGLITTTQRGKNVSAADRMEDFKHEFGLTDEDLNLNLGRSET